MADWERTMAKPWALSDYIRMGVSMREMLDILGIRVPERRGRAITIRCPAAWHDDENPS